MKIKNFFRTKWQYIFVFLLPWVMVAIHSVFREAWPLGGGGILVKDAGSLYLQLYSELWEKVHNGGSLTFSWSSGLGIDFLVNVFRYLMSPFTLLVLLVPKAAIADMVQVLMVLKWSLLAVSMLYYVSHTKHNTLENRRTLINVVLAMAYFLGNAVTSQLDDLAALDVMILFPLLALLVERVAERKNYGMFYILFVLTIFVNYALAIPVAIFLVIWYIMQFDEETPCGKKEVVQYIFVYVAAIMTGMLVMLPGAFSGIGVVERSKSLILSVGDFLQRLFICDSLCVVKSNQPMLYCSVMVVVLALFYVFTKGSLKRKICICILTVLLLVGLLTNVGNFIWNGALEISSGFVFLLTFIMIFMAMETMKRLESLRIWHVILVAAVSVSGVVYGFFEAFIMLDFYVYLGTLLLAVFMVLMLFFYCRKSIQYRNLLLVFVIVGLGELIINGYYCLQTYNEYAFEDTYYHADAEMLSDKLTLEAGERAIVSQVVYNYGMNLQLPGVAAEHANVNHKTNELYKALGMEWNDTGSTVFGASPLVNVMFNIRYGLGTGEVAYSDYKQTQNVNEYKLYEMNRLVGLGYMTDSQSTKWDVDKESPFEIQNDFIKKSTGVDEIFNIVNTEMSSVSLLGYDPDPAAHKHHHHEEGEMCDGDEEIYSGEYLENDVYYYALRKMYVEDYVYSTFVSDGKSDYYVYLKGSSPSITYVKIGDEYIYHGQLSSVQKTIHIGVIPEGEVITILSDFKVDDVDFAEIRYQVAAFNEENFSKAYDVLKRNVLQIAELEDGYVKGEITVDEAGVMMTSIPAMDGMKVSVDGEEIEYEIIGNALIGVSLTEGTHVVEFQYSTPYTMLGAGFSLIGVFLFVGVMLVGNHRKNNNEVIEG